MEQLTQEEWAELREAIGVWRSVRRAIYATLVVVSGIVVSLIIWGSSVESRFASIAKTDEALREGVIDIRRGQEAISGKIDKLFEMFWSQRYNGPPAAPNGGAK